ncbi:hypothetical protein PGSY75_0905600 [Plasmodium gaboni]|uniref:Cilia- and flagella-associated protein 251 n=1 Tax=Plasmodium gaboni TaxID=647221 RepID=A0A151LLF8_9APIC|nr:hypothetical protein PGSY75_0905600 [Plasmodium gaboni]KYO00041.1 hypothetical protein PGSY75_0905600 [Plasmodium gaboni]
MEKDVVDEPISLKFCYGINNSLSSVHIIERTNNNKEDKKNVENIKRDDSSKRDDHAYDENIYPFNNNDKRNNPKHIIYSSDNNIVLLDGKKQILFRGHFNKISNVIKSYNNEYILSCDKGLNSFIILWRVNDTSFLDPIKKFYYNSEENEKNGRHIYFNKKKNQDECDINKLNDSTIEDITDDGDAINDNVGYECIDISYDNRYICALTEERIYIKSNTNYEDETGEKGKNKNKTKDCILIKQNKGNKKNNIYYQYIIIFDINSIDHPIVCTDKIYGKDKQTKIRFNKKYEIISNSSSKLYIYNFQKKNRQISHYSPSLYKSNKINEQFIFTDTCFVDNTTTLLTGTTNGYIIVWDYSSIFINKTKHNIKQREYQKFLEIQKNVSINILHSYGDFIILGLSDGSVKVFDKELKCYAWFENNQVGSIKSISFQLCDFEKDFFLWKPFIIFSDKNIIKKIYPNSFNNQNNTTKEDQNLLYRTNHDSKNVHTNSFNDSLPEKYNKNKDKLFINKHHTDKEKSNTNININTNDSQVFSEVSKESTNINKSKKDNKTYMNTQETNQIYYIPSNQMNNTPTNEIVLHFNSSSISCICVNPINNDNIIYIGNENGLIEIFDFEKNEKVHSIYLKEKEIVSMIFTNNGKILCVGCKCGFVHLINSITFEIFFNSKDMKYEIKYLYFSEDDKIFLSSAIHANIIIYKNDSEDIYDWKYTYKISNKNNNNNITFNDLHIVKKSPTENLYNIVGITNNRYIIFHYYNFKDNTVNISYMNIEQIYVPTCISGNLYFYNRNIICICNDGSKLRYMDLETKKIIKTIHLPFKEKKVQKMLPLVMNQDKYNNDNTFNKDNGDNNTIKYKNHFDKKNIFLFVLNEKMIVFTQTPIDANCLRYIGGIICSGNIKDVISKNNNIFILSKNKIFYYQIHTSILKNSIDIQNNSLQTFIEQIGGTKSPMYNQIMDSFYYCEIQKNKYEKKKEKYNIKKLLNILSIEYIFASINIFLSKFEIQNIIQEYHFYYKYVINLLKQKKDSINHVIHIQDGQLINYKTDNDILLNNMYFLQTNHTKDMSGLNNSNSEQHILAQNSMSKNLKKKDSDLYTKNINQTNHNNNTNENQEDFKNTDITKECENIYFNINAFIYTYFNYITEENTDTDEIVEDIINYYKNENKKAKLSFNDLLNILNNNGEIMDQMEFKRIFQIFTKKDESFDENEFLNMDILKEMLE